ncbi:MAG: hypothetical protein ACFFCZ_20810 [Promethearchaeota archaeon]
MVIGRELKVRGVSFENFHIAPMIAEGLVGLRLIQRQERKFTNKFGKVIFENIIHFTPEKKRNKKL